MHAKVICLVFLWMAANPYSPFYIDALVVAVTWIAALLVGSTAFHNAIKKDFLGLVSLSTVPIFSLFFCCFFCLVAQRNN